MTWQERPSGAEASENESQLLQAMHLVLQHGEQIRLQSRIEHEMCMQMLRFEEQDKEDARRLEDLKRRKQEVQARGDLIRREFQHLIEQICWQSKEKRLKLEAEKHKTKSTQGVETGAREHDQKKPKVRFVAKTVGSARTDSTVLRREVLECCNTPRDNQTSPEHKMFGRAGGRTSRHKGGNRRRWSRDRRLPLLHPGGGRMRRHMSRTELNDEAHWKVENLRRRKEPRREDHRKAKRLKRSGVEHGVKSRMARITLE